MAVLVVALGFGLCANEAHGNRAARDTAAGKNFIFTSGGMMGSRGNGPLYAAESEAEVIRK
jgi:hypothetical protein